MTYSTWGAVGALGSPMMEISVRPASSAYADRVDITNRVVSMQFEDLESKADKLTLNIDNYNLSAFDDPLLEAGNIIVFRFGYMGAWSPEREMKIQGTKGLNPLVVEALGAEVTFARTIRPDSYWENVSRSDVARDIALQYGYAEEQLQIEDTKVVYPQITQGPQTDYRFLATLAAKEGFEFYTDFDGFHFHPRRLNQKALRSFEYFTDKQSGEVIGISVEDNKKPGKPGGVALTVRDPKTKETVTVRATEETTADRGTLATERTVVSSFERIDAVTGTTTLEEKNESLTLPSGNPLQAVAQDFKGPSSEPTVEGAQRQANAIYAKQQMRAVGFTLTIRGDGRVVAKSIIELTGIGPKMSGFYYVTSAKHDMSRSGFVTTLKIKRDGHTQRTGEGQFKATTATAKNPTKAVPTQGSPPANEVGVEKAPAFTEVFETIDPKTNTTTYATRVYRPTEGRP